MAAPILSPLPAHNPDAARWRKPANPPTDEQRESAVEIAERLLGIDPASRELAWVRDQVSYYFATRDPADTEFEPETRRPRYRWERLGDDSGEEVGWLAS